MQSTVSDVTTTWAPIDDIGQINDVRLRMAYARWSAEVKTGRLPRKDFVDEGKLADLMGWLFLFRIERDPLRFLYLLYGQKLGRRLGLDLTLKYADEHPDPGAREGIIGVLTAVATTGKPHLGVSTRRVLDRTVTTEGMALPLAGPDGIIDHLVAIQILDLPSDADD